VLVYFYNKPSYSGYLKCNEVKTVEDEAWLDVAVTRCPGCGRFYADASWYIVEMASDTECGSCHQTFNTKTHLTDRIMLRLKIDGNGNVETAEVTEHV